MNKQKRIAILIVLTIMSIICFSMYKKLKSYNIYESTYSCTEVNTYTLNELYKNYSSGVSKYFLSPQNTYKIKPTFDTRGININSSEGIIKFAQTKEIQEIKYGGTCIGNEENTVLTQIEYKNYIITNYEGITELNIDEQIDKLKEFFLNIDVILNDFGNYISIGRYDGEGDSIEELDLFLNQYVDLSRIERELLHDVISLYIKSKEVEIFNEYFNDNTNLSSLWLEYAHLKGIDELLVDIDNILLENSDDIEKLSTEDFDIVMSDNYIEVVDNKKESKLTINDVSIPPLTFAEFKNEEILEVLFEPTFGSRIDRLVDYNTKKNQLSLYSLIMIEELAQQYNYEDINNICPENVQKSMCIKDYFDTLMDEQSSDKEKEAAIKIMGEWLESQKAEITNRILK